MWGDGSQRPGPNPFVRQFEPEGKNYIYRRNLEGLGVKVSPQEYEEIVSRYEKKAIKLFFLTIMIWLGFAVAFMPIENFLTGNLGNWSIYLSAFPTAAYVLWQRKQNWDNADIALAARHQIGLNRSPQDARRLRFALSGWSPIRGCALIAAVPFLVLFDGVRPRAADWLWLVPYMILVGGGLAWWSLRKAQAIRVCRL